MTKAEKQIAQMQECDGIVAKVQRIKELQNSLKDKDSINPNAIINDMMENTKLLYDCQAEAAYIEVRNALFDTTLHGTMLALARYISDYVQAVREKNDIDAYNAPIIKEINQLKEELGIK